MDVFFQGGDDILWTWLYWEAERGLSSSVFSRFGGGLFSLSVEIPLPADKWFHTHPGPLWSHPALKWARSDWGHGWVWHLDPGQDRWVGRGSPDLKKSEVQFLEMNYRVQVLSVGEWICSSVVELAKSLFVCYAASNDITWFSTKARVKGGSSGFRWPSLWKMSSRKRLKDSLRPKRNLPLINSSAFMPNDNLPRAVLTVVSYVEMEVWSACDIFAQ